MTPKDCFGIVVRTLGLAVMIASIAYFYSTAMAALIPTNPRYVSPLAYLAIGVVYLSISIYLLRGAPALLDFCYPKDKSDSSR